MKQQSKVQVFTAVLRVLMAAYHARVACAGVIMNAMVERGVLASTDHIINDHIAFRTFRHPLLGIASLARIFEYYGYTRRDKYVFKAKKLDAYWFSPPQGGGNLPRIFISECKVEALSPQTQAILARYCSQVQRNPVDSLELNNSQQVGDFFHTALWSQPTYEDYMAVYAESPYAAWVLYNRYYLNHFTLTIQQLPVGYNTIAQFNAFVKSLGIPLNTAGGEIKVSADKRLIQSATLADVIPVVFKCEDGTHITHAVSYTHLRAHET